MSDSAALVFRRFNHTPLRDLLRGRLSGRLDWKARLAASGLPADAAEFVARMVKRAGFFELERAAVADELIAHFRNGLAAGSSAAELVQRFGDERRAARLIRARTISLAGAGLPTAVADLIARVVKRTRLFRMEKAAVADDLVDHFLDGLAAGSSAAELVETFGDERVASKLIRIAKRRGRPLPWRVGGVAVRVMAVLLGIYAVLLLRFCLSRPTPTIDYLARLNQPIIQTAPQDRAWPIWRQAILASSDGLKDAQLNFPQAIDLPRSGLPWQDTVNWLNEHASAVELARQAGRKPALGFIDGPGGSADDRQLGFSSDGHGPNDLLAMALLPHLNPLINIAHLLSLDARRAAERGDGAIAEADIMSLLSLGRQLRESDGLLVTQEVAIEVDDIALSRIRLILFNSPASLSNDALVRLAHAISGPEVAADTLSLKHERFMFADLVQRLYTDDGHGDGHMTLWGLRSAPLGFMKSSDSGSQIDLTFEAASAVPLLTASRAELMAEYDRMMDLEEADFKAPLRQIAFRNVESQMIAMRQSPLDALRYAVLVDMLPSFSNAEENCEVYLGERDGTLVGIALEMYRRQHGRYPTALAELTPDFLPRVPLDRITGEPVKYLLIDGKPLVYSIGADRIDDGGHRPEHTEQYFRSPAAAWGVEPAKAARGDWVLFASDPSDENNDLAAEK